MTTEHWKSMRSMTIQAEMAYRARLLEATNDLSRRAAEFGLRHAVGLRKAAERELAQPQDAART